MAEAKPAPLPPAGIELGTDPSAIQLALSIESPVTTFYQDRLVVAWLENDGVYLLHQKDDGWQPLGPSALPRQPSHPRVANELGLRTLGKETARVAYGFGLFSLAVGQGAEGELMVAWYDDAPPWSGNLRVFLWDGSNWHERSPKPRRGGFGCISYSPEIGPARARPVVAISRRGETFAACAQRLWAPSQKRTRVRFPSAGPQGAMVARVWKVTNRHLRQLPDLDFFPRLRSAQVAGITLEGGQVALAVDDKGQPHIMSVLPGARADQPGLIVRARFDGRRWRSEREETVAGRWVRGGSTSGDGAVFVHHIAREGIVLLEKMPSTGDLVPVVERMPARVVDHYVGEWSPYVHVGADQCSLVWTTVLGFDVHRQRALRVCTGRAATDLSGCMAGRRPSELFPRLAVDADGDRVALVWVEGNEVRGSEWIGQAQKALPVVTSDRDETIPERAAAAYGPRGTLLLATAQKDSQLVIRQREGEKWQLLPGASNAKADKRRSYPWLDLRMTVTDKGHIVVTSRDGLQQWDGQSWRWLVHSLSLSPNHEAERWWRQSMADHNGGTTAFWIRRSKHTLHIDQLAANRRDRDSRAIPFVDPHTLQGAVYALDPNGSPLVVTVRNGDIYLQLHDGTKWTTLSGKEEPCGVSCSPGQSFSPSLAIGAKRVCVAWSEFDGARIGTRRRCWERGTASTF
jgi:hypothetical protein